jgi:alpha-beta hydrolase superfamily lysophospholipase
MTPHSYEGVKARYEARGFKVLAPAWPGMEGSVEELNRNPAPIAAQAIPKILDHYERIIRSLDKPPIIMGHSFGGGFMQVLLDRGLGAAGVGFAAATVKGVRDVPLSTLRSSWTLWRNPILRNKAVPLSLKGFQYAFTNNLSVAESEPLWKKYCVPGSRNVLLTGANTNVSLIAPLKVNLKNDNRAPLLFCANGNDHVVPASANLHNAQKYRSKSVTAFKEFPNRNHLALGMEGWDEIADFALDWALDPKPL